MRELHLFAGIGGGIQGSLLLGHTPVGAVEINPYCRQVLRERQADGTLPPFPIYEDIREFDGKPWHNKVDVVSGGFPCQPWSLAGETKGRDDERDLWPEMARIVDEVRPSYVFAENVQLAAFEQPWGDLRRMGYRVPPAIRVSAANVGAPHLRNRWWLLAADPDSERLAQREGERGDSRTELTTIIRSDWWASEPRVRRVLNGVPDRVHRLRALGNAQVPQCAATAWLMLMEMGA